MGAFIFGLILILIGISALVGIELFKFIFAVILIVVGVRIITRHPRRPHGTIGEETDVLDEVAIFSPLHRRVTSPTFRGGKVTLIFSGAELDLRGATLIPGTTLEIVAIFSGCRIFVPIDWKVESRGAAILGGFANHAAQGAGMTLVVTGSAIFGGVEILN